MRSEELTALHRLRNLLGERLVVMGRAEMSYSNGEIAGLIGAIDLVDDVVAKWEKLAIVRPATTKDMVPADHIARSVDSLNLESPFTASALSIQSEGMTGASFSKRVEWGSCPRCGTIHQCEKPQVI